jgi:HEPN domain-containing protein
MAKGKVVEAQRRTASLHLQKGKEFLADAEAALKRPAYDAALLNAIHAVIAAADAVCVAYGGRRSADPDHQRVGDLLVEIVGEPARLPVGHLRTLVAKKNLVEYESRRASAKEGQEGVKKAARFVGWAEDMVQKTKL